MNFKAWLLPRMKNNIVLFSLFGLEVVSAAARTMILFFILYIVVPRNIMDDFVLLLIAAAFQIILENKFYPNIITDYKKQLK